MSPLRPPSRRLAAAWFLTSRNGRVARSAGAATLMLSGFVFTGLVRWPLLLLGAGLFAMALLNICPLGSWLRAPGRAATTPRPALRVVPGGAPNHAPPTQRSA